MFFFFVLFFILKQIKLRIQLINQNETNMLN